jgi:hypothetical protein
MTENTIGKIPEFTSDETSHEEPIEEVKPEAAIEVAPIEKETPVPPTEKPLAPSKEEYSEPMTVEDKNAVQGLLNERVKLLKEISELKGQKRELKQEQLQRVQTQIDELKDLHPQDVEVIDRVLRAKGFITREEAESMHYKAVENEELNKFLEKYPEYKPENDPNDANWAMLQREIALYKQPSNPRQIAEILDRAHRAIVRAPAKVVSDPVIAKKRQVEIASAGSGGSQRSSPVTKFDSAKRAMLERGGWSEEEIQKMESKSS